MLAAFAAVALVLASAGHAAARDGSNDRPDGGKQEPAADLTFTETLLSNELDTSRWAFVGRQTSARAEPSRRARRVLRLKRRTPDRTDELVLTLRERVYSDGSIWTEVRLPMRGADARGWVERSALGRYRVIHARLEVDRSAMTATLFKNGAQVWSARVGVGTGDRTPAGSYYVRSRLTSVNPRGRFGPFGFGLSAQSSARGDWPHGRTVGIHGTRKPGVIPGRSSDPCVRLRNEDLRSLWKLIPPGTPVAIR